MNGLLRDRKRCTSGMRPLLVMYIYTPWVYIHIYIFVVMGVEGSIESRGNANTRSHASYIYYTPDVALYLIDGELPEGKLNRVYI